MMANSAEYWVVALYSWLALTGLFGNVWVMLSVLGELCRCCQPQWPHVRCKPAVHCSATVYLLVLSVVDLISILPVPLLATDILYNKWPFGLLLCKLLFFCEGANKSLSPLVLTALSVDRYVAVCRSTLVWLRQSKFALLILLACFLLSLFFIMPVVYFAEINDMVDANYREHSKCVVQMPKSFDIMHVFTCYLLPLLLICSVYVAILHRLYQHTRTSTVGRRTSISLGRVLKCSVFVVAFYFICWTPYWALRIVAVLQEPSESLVAGYDVETVLNGSLEFVHDVDIQIDGEHYNVGDVSGQEVALMYMVHALPYAQSAFNWLFYAFLNRNLRQSSSRCSTAIRSVAITSNFFDSVHRTSANSTVVSLWGLLQNAATRLRGAAGNTGDLLLRQSWFHPGWHITVRSSWAFIERAETSDAASMRSKRILTNTFNSLNGESCMPTRGQRYQTSIEEDSSQTPCLAMSEYTSAEGDAVKIFHESASCSAESQPLCTQRSLSEGSSVEWL
ncbi:putative G-protein coupled receptor C06G4.5 [Toxocara canis]|uniref:Putative G-protein coupled receptor C06G4.5 n=1 Tax=Toxocara canis TaxID=6265 RepID=A0A0B2W5G7_TOXCA|nr:putative G-protein coupled receptor C06G4.5 [Toxocara canis]